MRLFFAVELPDDVRAALGRLRPPGESGADYRWVDPGLMHVTLAFLGEQPAEALPRLESIAQRVASACTPGTLRLGEAGSFGARRAPRVLWVGLDGDLDALQHVYSRLDERLRAAGFPTEDRAFRPHITLARRRERASGGPLAWPPQHVEHPRFTMDALTLFESRLSPRGATYTALVRAPLQPA